MLLLNKYRLNYIYKNNLEFHICIIVDTGIKKSEKYSKGLAHFVEHIIYRRIMKVFEKTKCSIYAETNNLYTYFSIKGEKSYINSVLNNIEIVLNPKPITINEIKTEKEIILAEKYQKEKNPFYVFNRGICKQNYNDALNIIGNESDILNVDINELNDFIANKYKKKNILVTIIGNINIFNKLKSYEYVEDNSNPVFYYNDSIFSVYFNIPGMGSHLYYMFNVIKYMILGELNEKYKKISVKIIRVDNNKSYFVINGYLNGINKEDIVNEIISLIHNKKVFNLYLTKYSEYIQEKLESHEFLVCITSILKLLEVYDVYKLKLLNINLISEEDYNECKKYFNINDISYKFLRRN